MAKYLSLNTATQQHIERLEADIFAMRERLIIVHTPPERKLLQKSISEKSRELAKNFAVKESIKVAEKPAKKVLKKRVKKVKKVAENERKFWD